MNDFDAITIASEPDSLEEQAVAMQSAINSGTAWKMEGSFGRAAMRMIENGVCMTGKETRFTIYGSPIPSRNVLKAGTKGTEDYCRSRQPEIIEILLAKGL